MTARATASHDSHVLLGDAVHKHRLLSTEGALERLFTYAFRDLVYAQIWEDPRVDMTALAIEPSSRIVTIASGGCNALSYLSAKPERIHAVDLNASHVALVRLKIAALQNLPDHDAMFALLGRGDGGGNADLYRTLAPHLDPETRAYWQGRDSFGRRRYMRFCRGLYRHGLLGHFISLAHTLARLHGTDPRAIMRARTRDEQVEIYQRELAPLFDGTLVRWLLGHRAALYGLGIPPAQYTALIGDASHMADVVRERLRKLVCDFDLNDNYFAWQAFNRAYPSDGHGPHPPYLDRHNYETVRAAAGRLSVEVSSFTGFLKRQGAGSLDRYVLLDAQDWMDDATLDELWLEITRTSRPGARVIFRTAGIDTILPGRVAEHTLSQWAYQADQSASLTRADRSAIYGGFHLYVKQP